jgi:hypothetical protein
MHSGSVSGTGFGPGYSIKCNSKVKKRRHTGRLSMRDNFRQKRGEGLGKELNQTMARKPGSLHIIQYSQGFPHSFIISELICTVRRD